MGNTNSIIKINFENIQDIILNKNDTYILINTLDSDDQNILIKNTLNVTDEIQIINKILKKEIQKNYYLW